MPSQLYTNDKISFVAAKPFTYRAKDYAIGDDFPQEEANNIETMVRARFIIPVVEELTDKPRHWHKHVRPRAEVLERLNRERTQIKMPHEPDSDEVVNLNVLTHPEQTPEPSGEGGEADAEVSEEAEVGEDELPEGLEFDPADYTVDEVKTYLAEHPEDRDAVLAAEEAGKGRKGILEA